MEAVKRVYLLLICQGFYLGSVCQQWTFPSEVTALLGSCVEIRCAFSPYTTSTVTGTVWYLYDEKGHPEVLNTMASSSVLKEYRDRTSLLSGEKSCTLRIDPVRREDGGKHYYPGIGEVKTINAYYKQNRTVYLNVTDEGFRLNSVIFPAVIGTICLLLLIVLALLGLLVYCCWRKCRKSTNNKSETSPDDAIYIDLERRDMESDYEQYKPMNSTTMRM
ncbi:uncharacterized protein [Dendropsophus ebraccatus]|uniref:uncharacterized protein n=1 Tax=Dendropsophus ebraccatus TaxID=150705 RepID=UPI003831829E